MLGPKYCTTDDFLGSTRLGYRRNTFKKDQITATQFYVTREAMNCSLDLMYLAALLTREHAVMQDLGTKDNVMDLCDI